jgi:nucleoside-diphosphate-sugar epimerase
MRRAIISGVTGFIGQELARQLERSGIEVHGLTRAAQRTSTGSIQTHRIDGRTETVVEIFQTVRPDYVVHLAGLARREHLVDDVIPFVQANIILGAQLLEAMRLSGCMHFITAGSYLQYSDDGLPRAMNLYAGTKHAFSQIIDYYVDAFGISAATLILCNIYGEQEQRPQLITDIATALVEGRTLALHGDEAWIDPVHVEDAAAAFVRTMQIIEDYPAGGRLLRYSVTCGQDISATELISMFESIGGRKLNVQRNQFCSATTRRTRPWRGQVIPGWTPKVEIRTGIQRLLWSRIQRERADAALSSGHRVDSEFSSTIIQSPFVGSASGR